MANIYTVQPAGSSSGSDASAEGSEDSRTLTDMSSLVKTLKEKTLHSELEYQDTVTKAINYQNKSI